MELDELRQKWLEHDRKLEISIRLNRQLLRDTYTRRARFALWRLGTMLAAGSVILLAIVVSLGRFIHENRGMPQFVWPAVTLDVFAIATLACLILQIALALHVDYDQPVAVIQKQLERLRKIRIRYIQGVCLGMTLTWAPIFMVVMKAALGVDVLADVRPNLACDERIDRIGYNPGGNLDCEEGRRPRESKIPQRPRGI